MAIVTRYSKGYPDPTQLSAYKTNAHEARSNVKASFFNIAVGNGDSINSVYCLARVPSYGMLLPLSSLYSGGIAGLTALSVGLDNRIGTKLPGVLMNAVNVSAQGGFPFLSAVAPANYGLRLWQLLGLGSDPKVDLDIIATLGAAPTAAGVICGHIYWDAIGS